MQFFLVVCCNKIRMNEAVHNRTWDWCDTIHARDLMIHIPHISHDRATSHNKRCDSYVRLYIHGWVVYVILWSVFFLWYGWWSMEDKIRVSWWCYNLHALWWCDLRRYYCWYGAPLWMMQSHALWSAMSWLMRHEIVPSMCPVIVFASVISRSCATTDRTASDGVIAW